MPSNHILINTRKAYIVADSQMDDLLYWLDENGHVVNTGIKQEPDEIIVSGVTSNILSESYGIILKLTSLLL